jgi:hypothetical protein
MIGASAAIAPGAQVVAVAEAARQDERVDAFEVVRAVPQRDGLGSGEADRALGVAVVERAGEGDDPDASGHSTTSMPTTSSITEFDRISSAMRCGLARTSSVDLALDGELEALADAHGREVLDAEPRERTRHGLALRVEQFGFGHDVDDDGGHEGSGCRGWRVLPVYGRRRRRTRCRRLPSCNQM